MDLGRDLFDNYMRSAAETFGPGGIQEELIEARVEAKSDSGAVTVVVGPPGVIQSLTLDDKIKKMGLADVAAQIVELTNAASALLKNEVGERVHDALPSFDPVTLLTDFNSRQA